jgi:hydroxymethylglutaryl-CoA lyase
MDQNLVKMIECPRDAMQGWKNFIPTEKKIQYINSLLKVGFDTLDMGSFVSARAIPQMADTKEVIRNLEPGSSRSKLLVIIANVRGAEEAIAFEKITYLGFRFLKLFSFVIPIQRSKNHLKEQKKFKEFVRHQEKN